MLSPPHPHPPIPSAGSLAVAHSTYFAHAEMLNSSFHCAQQKQAIAAFGPAAEGGGGRGARFSLLGSH